MTAIQKSEEERKETRKQEKDKSLTDMWNELFPYRPKTFNEIMDIEMALTSQERLTNQRLSYGGIPLLDDLEPFHFYDGIDLKSFMAELGEFPFSGKNNTYINDEDLNIIDLSYSLNVFDITKFSSIEAYHSCMSCYVILQALQKTTQIRIVINDNQEFVSTFNRIVYKVQKKLDNNGCKWNGLFAHNGYVQFVQPDWKYEMSQDIDLLIFDVSCSAEDISKINNQKLAVDKYVYIVDDITEIKEEKEMNKAEVIKNGENGWYNIIGKRYGVTQDDIDLFIKLMECGLDGLSVSIDSFSSTKAYRVLLSIYLITTLREDTDNSQYILIMTTDEFREYFYKVADIMMTEEVYKVKMYHELSFDSFNVNNHSIRFVKPAGSMQGISNQCRGKKVSLCIVDTYIKEQLRINMCRTLQGANPDAEVKFMYNIDTEMSEGFAQETNHIIAQKTDECRKLSLTDFIENKLKLTDISQESIDVFEERCVPGTIVPMDMCKSDIEFYQIMAAYLLKTVMCNENENIFVVTKNNSVLYNAIIAQANAMIDTDHFKPFEDVLYFITSKIYFLHPETISLKNCLDVKPTHMIFDTVVMTRPATTIISRLLFNTFDISTYEKNTMIIQATEEVGYNAEYSKFVVALDNAIESEKDQMRKDFMESENPSISTLCNRITNLIDQEIVIKGNLF